MILRPASILVVFICLAACGTDVHEADAARMDSSALQDAARPDSAFAMDATVLDAATLDAASNDGGLRDSGIDADPMAADAGPVCTPGMIRVATCGACGTESQTCNTDGYWEATSACLGQLDCIAGTVESREGERCAEEQRVCLSSCTFTEWEETSEPRDCEPGTTRTVDDPACPVGEARQQSCIVGCEWGPTTATCVDACGGALPPRTAPDWAREVCIPASSTVRGVDGGSPNYGPESIVDVSGFYMDVFPVTYRRYQSCVTSGRCNAPEGIFAQTGSEFLDYPVQGIERRDAIAFCDWDGGRVLPTSTQWEKAGRGPAPRRPTYPWGDELDCLRVPTNRSPCDAGLPVSFPEHLLALDAYTAFPAEVASYFGVQMLGFGAREWVLDAVCVDWYGSPDSVESDPVCDASETILDRYVVRGSTRLGMVPLWEWSASLGVGTMGYRSQGFRCVRRP